MSQLPKPGKVNWNSRLKFVVVYPSEFDIGGGDQTEVEYVLGVVEEVGVEGIGYMHEDIDGITNWGLGKRTKPSNNKVGRIVVSETEWVYTFLRWLAASDARFDVKVVELDELQNPGRGQWAAGQESYIGCFVDPFGKTYEKGEQPYASIPFTWTLFKYITGNQSVYIGEGIFNVAGLPPTPPETQV